MYMHKYTHTNTHTYIHTYIYTHINTHNTCTQNIFIHSCGFYVHASVIYDT